MSTYTKDALSTVKEFNLSGYEIKKIEGLEAISNITALYLDVNGITKIEGLDAAPMLLTLNLAYNSISNIEGLENLKQLRILNLSGNGIMKITGLDKLENLRQIVLFNNPIKEIEVTNYYWLKLRNVRFYIDNRMNTDIDSYLAKYKIPIPNISAFRRTNTAPAPLTNKAITNTNG